MNPRQFEVTKLIANLLVGATVWLTVGFLSSQRAQAEAPRGGADAIITCAGVEEGQAVLTHRDDFIAALSGFDRAARLKTDRPVADAETTGPTPRCQIATTTNRRDRCG